MKQSILHNVTRARSSRVPWGIALSGLLIAGPLHAGWIAYNDSAFKDGQINAENVTTFGLGRNFAGEGTSGNLLHFSNGTDTGIQVSFTEFITTGSVNNAGDAATYAPGSDAEALFAGRVDLSGNMSYGDSPGWYVDLTITGLDPAKKYTFAGTVDRAGGQGYTDRVTNWRVMGAEGYTPASSPGAHVVGDDAVEFSTGHNPNGLVARWTDIEPGADGTVVIRTTHTVGEANGGMPGAHSSRGYAGGIFLFAEQLDDWTAFNDSAFKQGQINAENVTTYGLGRNFAGEASFGPLRDIDSGADSLARVEYVEHFSAGSVNNAGDFAEYGVGSDAAAIFGGIVDISGNMSYGDEPGWYVDLIISGLDPTKLYTFAGTANRNGGPGYADRVTHWRIMGADSFTYASSEGAHRVDEDSVEFSTGHNPNGLVAQWSHIAPGSDGRIVIRTTHTVGEANGGMPGAHASRGYAGGAFMVHMQPTQAYRWNAFNDSAFKEGQTNAEFVTTYGLGRNFAGEATSGPLRNVDTGELPGVNAAYTEFFSTGSVNNAGDFAAYPAGSDAEAVFAGIVDFSGNMSYGDEPGWYVDLTFTGLNPDELYTFVGTAHRNGGPGYADRVTHWRILGAESYVYASSAGAHRVGEDSVEFSTGDNSAGYVARWLDVSPGADGTFVIRTTHTVGEAMGGLPGAHASRGYAGGVFMLGEQTGSLQGGSGRPLELSNLYPLDAATGVHPNTPVRLSIRSGDQDVDVDSIEVRFNDAVVAHQVEVDGDFVWIMYQPPASLTSGSSHTVRVDVSDTATNPMEYSREWSFTVLDYSGFTTLPQNLAIPFNATMHRHRGFAMRINSPVGWSMFSIEDALSVFEWELANLVDPSIFNDAGYYLERDTINYQINGITAGNKAGDRTFPGIPSAGEPGSEFALRAHALLHLRPGYYRFNITMQPGFQLSVGSGESAVIIPAEFTPCTNCGGDDGPWFMDLVVTQEGLYPFELLFYNNGGNTSLEWLEVAPSGLRHLINDTDPEAIAAYIPADKLGTVAEDILVSVQQTATGIQLDWNGGGTLESAPTAEGPWTTVQGAVSGHVIAASGAQAFFRIRE